MASISRPYSYSANTTILSAEVNSDFNTIYNDYNGNITNVNVAAGAAIAGSKLETNPTFTGSLTLSGTTSRVRAYASAGQTIEHNTAEKVLLNTETYDGASEFNTTTNRFTATLAGRYMVVGVINGQANGCLYAELRNSAGTTLSVGSLQGPNLTYIGASIVFDVLNLAAADTVELWGNNPHNGDINVTAGSVQTHLTILKLS